MEEPACQAQRPPHDNLRPPNVMPENGSSPTAVVTAVQLSPPPPDHARAVLLPHHHLDNLDVKQLDSLGEKQLENSCGLRLAWQKYKEFEAFR